MNHPELSPTNKFKEAFHIITDALRLLIPSIAIVAAAYHAVGEGGSWPPSTVFLLTYTLLISIPLYILEAYFICSKAHRYPEFVYRSLNFLTTFVGRALFYQCLGALYIIAYPTGRWNWGYYQAMWANERSRVLGLIIWGIGAGMLLVDVFARAYHVTSWVWDPPRDKEGQLRLESDEEDGGLVLVPDRGLPKP